MLDGLRVFGRALRHLNQRGYIYVWATVLWAVLTLPIITAPAAWAGLVRMSFYAHRQPRAGLDDFWIGFRQNFWRGIPIALFNAVLLVITISNLLSYADQTGIGFVVLRLIWILTLLFVLIMQFFGWCFFYAMKQPSLIGGLRNTAVMLLNNPGFSMVVLIGALLISILSSLLPAAWFLITGGALAALANSAVQDRLRAAGIEAQPTFDENMIVDAIYSDDS
ncbi:MAG: DUF624 domain-containing protein [Anaerolineae bacterium]|nr:DUF624 domain-containing protein [Anaerolineae bacterium]